MSIEIGNLMQSITDLPMKRKRPPHAGEPHKRIKKNPIRSSPKPHDLYVLADRTPVRAYVARAQKLLNQQSFPFVIIHGLGKAIYKATLVATLLQERSVGNVDISVETDTVQLTDELDYHDEDIEPEVDCRNSSAIHITIKRKQSIASLVGSPSQLALSLGPSIVSSSS